MEQSVGLAPLAFGGVRETTYLQPRHGRGFFLGVASRNPQLRVIKRATEVRPRGPQQLPCQVERVRATGGSPSVGPTCH